MTTFQELANWSPADVMALGVDGATVAANEERHRRALAILAEYDPDPEDFDVNPLLALLISHRGDLRAAADDPALIEHLRSYIGVDPLLVQVWQDLERIAVDSQARPVCGGLGDLITAEVNAVRARAGLSLLTSRQVAARRLRDVIREVTAALDVDRGRSDDSMGQG
ncbi:hypothetical protein [Luteipulveratus mongoliensis]|uniref:Uncharacterized protein n=1 Tax=Luteipulveratus mongoliensis TaxID=571913 RepID=A0A0K1JNC5_9MICO|nr:hypothetical protein [Luteipulveratus mongoliensis]AKU18103.1 hypothetical protein VV02_23275 [Luteipulveratus mongoliensis]